MINELDRKETEMNETGEIFDIVALLKEPGLRLIGIDGVDGSGKSTLAISLSTELGFRHINIDNHTDEYFGQYVPHVRYDELERKIDEAEGPIIIEGVCLLAVLGRLHRNLDILIYVKRIFSYGRWRDEEKCDVNEDINHFINTKKEELRKFEFAVAHIEGKEVPDISDDKLDEEIIRYHCLYRPHEKADIIYKRIEG